MARQTSGSMICPECGKLIGVGDGGVRVRLPAGWRPV